MKITKKKTSKKPILMVLLAFFVVAAAYVVFAHHYRWWPFITSPETTAQQAHQQDVNQPALKNNTSTPKSNKNVDATKTTDQVTQNTDLSITITSLVQQNGSVTYQAELNDTNQNGSCVAEYTTDGAKPITSTTNAKSGVCGPISIPEIQFTKLGSWTLTLHYYTDNTEAVTTKIITIH